MKLEKQACMLALAAILLLIVGAFVVGFPAGTTLAEGTDIDLNTFEGSVILDDPVYFQDATPDEPEVKPTQQPTTEPTQAPSEHPTAEPTLEPTAEPTAQPTAMPEYIQTGPGQAFTGSGNMHTLDVLYSAHTNKQFISLETKSGQTYYLVIDYDKPIDEEADIYETYFLNLVDDRDLLALLSEDEKPTPTPTAAPTPTPTKEPVQTDETEPKQNGTVVAGALMLAILGGGAFWYLKQRKKKESRPQPSYDEYEDDEDDETRDDDLNE